MTQAEREEPLGLDTRGGRPPHAAPDGGGVRHLDPVAAGRAGAQFRVGLRDNGSAAVDTWAAPPDARIDQSETGTT
jgi:hypothetical protein